VGLGIPLIFGSQKSAVQVSTIEQRQAMLELSDYQQHLTNKRRQLFLQLEKYQRAIEYYNETGKALSEALIRSSDRAFKSGEIDFFQYIQTLDRGIQIQIDYLYNLHQYNRTALSLNYLIY
jgi:cobalt-zinc-cadmium resistance protein CzcA